MLIVLTNQENDHVGLRNFYRRCVQAHALEQGQAYRGQTAAAAKTRLVDPDQTSNGGP
jgi:hypothetical protein